MHKLSSQRIVLASGSPRRKLILSNIGLNVEVIPSSCEENLDKSQFEFPYLYARATAKMKILEVADKLSQENNTFPDLIIGADTVVALDQKIYEKPKDKEHAFRTLSELSGKTHYVHTGVVLLRPNKNNQGDDPYNMDTFHVTTEVKFASLNPDIIRSYIETGEPMDKAGGYGIQAAGGTLVEGINGDYFNVMGFPLHQFAKRLYEYTVTCNNKAS